MTFEEYAAGATWYVRLENSIVAEVLSNSCPDDENPPIPDGDEYVAINFSDGIQVGWGYDGTSFFEIPRKDLTITEWTNTFAPSEWEEAENAAYVVGSLINGEVVSAGVRQQWRQYLDGIKSNIPSVNPPLNAVIINAGEVEDYYNFLVAQSFITEERKTELQLGILTS